MRINEILQEEENFEEKYGEVIKEYFSSKKFIYRGIRNRNKFIELDGSTMNRRAANTSNEVNLLVSNLPSWKDFPKRTQSFICTTDRDYAEAYGRVYYIIPLENQNIGICIREDFWDSFPKMRVLDIHTPRDFNHFFGNIVRESGLSNYNGYLLDHYEELLEVINHVEKNLEKIHGDKFFSTVQKKLLQLFKEERGVLKSIESLLNPYDNGFKVVPYDEFVPEDKKEVWLSGKILMVEESLGDVFVRKYS